MAKVNKSDAALKKARAAYRLHVRCEGKGRAAKICCKNFPLRKTYQKHLEKTKKTNKRTARWLLQRRKMEIKNQINT